MRCKALAVLLKFETLSDSFKYFGINSFMCVSHQCFTSHYKASIEINLDSCSAKGWKCEQHVTLRL